MMRVTAEGLCMSHPQPHTAIQPLENREREMDRVKEEREIKRGREEREKENGEGERT